MDRIILNEIFLLLSEKKSALRIPMRQRSKFEGWLKIELAHRLVDFGMEDVALEKPHSYYIPDLSFIKDGNFHQIELKTCNTNWKIKGVDNKGKPISSNIKSILRDTKKLNSKNGIVAFVMFPIPFDDDRWEKYISRIEEEAEIKIDRETNCKLVEMEVDEVHKCNALICVYKSKEYSAWW